MRGHPGTQETAEGSIAGQTTTGPPTIVVATGAQGETVRRETATPTRMMAPARTIEARRAGATGVEGAQTPWALMDRARRVLVEVGSLEGDVA